MPKNMSFSLTTDQIRNRTKTVTRRKGWWKNKHGKRLLHVGDVLNACVKCQGLKPGESIERISLIKVTNVRREKLLAMVGDDSEAELEGFPEMLAEEFVAMFCKHMGGDAGQSVTRIEFEYLYESPDGNGGYVCGYCGESLKRPDGSLGLCCVCFDVEIPQTCPECGEGKHCNMINTGGGAFSLACYACGHHQLQDRDGKNIRVLESVP